MSFIGVHGNALIWYNMCAQGNAEVKYACTYRTPVGMDDLVMSGDGEALTGLWFRGSRDDVARGVVG